MHIPYKGAGFALTAVLTGETHAAFLSTTTASGQVKAGKLKALAVMSPKRFAAAPDIPTVAEAVLPGFETGSWQGIVAPAGTPPEVVRKLHADVMTILNTPEMKERLDKAGAEVRAMSPQQFGGFIRDEKVRWAKVAKDSGEKFE